MAVVISRVSTASEQERNGQDRRDVGKSVHVRQAIMDVAALMDLLSADLLLFVLISTVKSTTM